MIAVNSAFIIISYRLLLTDVELSCTKKQCVVQTFADLELAAGYKLSD